MVYGWADVTTGTKPEDAQFLSLKFEQYGVDFVDLSGGTFESRAFEHKKESTVSTDNNLPPAVQKIAHRLRRKSEKHIL
jgi:hypothetical protein